MHILFVDNYVPYNWFLNQTISHNDGVFFACAVDRKDSKKVLYYQKAMFLTSSTE